MRVPRRNSSKGADFTVLFYEVTQKSDKMWQKWTTSALFKKKIYKINK
jgi:hypothetical protein